MYFFKNNIQKAFEGAGWRFRGEKNYPVATPPYSS
jgi:hypothetical protein